MAWPTTAMRQPHKHNDSNVAETRRHPIAKEIIAHNQLMRVCAYLCISVYEKRIIAHLTTFNGSTH